MMFMLLMGMFFSDAISINEDKLNLNQALD